MPVPSAHHPVRRKIVDFLIMIIATPYFAFLTFILYGGNFRLLTSPVQQKVRDFTGNDKQVNTPVLIGVYLGTFIGFAIWVLIFLAVAWIVYKAVLRSPT